MQRFSTAVLICIVGLWPGTSTALEANEVESFLEAYLPSAMSARQIPGLAITVVEGDRPLVTKGYGVADVETKRPVDPEETLFDVQSVSKLMVSMAAMIASRDGLIRLDDDVDRYLKGLRIPATYGNPITLAALLTHTSGLEDRGTGITARTPAEVQPLDQFLARTLTQRVAPPFTRLLYSDQGMTLAAYTIQSATGVPFDEYVRREIFEPLRMTHSHYLDVPQSLQEERAAGYGFEDGRLVRVRHDYYDIWPVSSLWTTAADMGRFIGVHLENGAADGARILDPTAMQQLHTRQFSYDARMPGVCFDFFEHFENGRRLLIHSGEGSGFSSELVLLPDEGTGYFFTYNADVGSLIAAFRSAFLDRFYPAPRRSEVQTIVMPREQLAPYEGWYWSTRNDRRTIEKLSSLVDGYLEVGATSGGLVVDGRRFSAVDETVFVNRDGDEPEFIAFRKDDSGRVTDLLRMTSAAPYERVPWIFGQPAQLATLAVSLLTFAIVVLYTAIALVRGRTRAEAMHWTNVYLALLCLGNLVSLIVLAIDLAGLSSPLVETEFELGVPTGLRALVAIISGLAVFNLASPVVAGFVWYRARETHLRGTLASLVSAVALLHVWFLDTWNVIGFRF